MSDRKVLLPRVWMVVFTVDGDDDVRSGLVPIEPAFDIGAALIISDPLVLAFHAAGLFKE